MSPLLLDFETKGFEPNYWKATKKHGHWNIKAHEYIGHYLAKELIKKGLYN